MKHKLPRFETNLPNIVIAFLLILLFLILSNQSTALAAQPQVVASNRYTVGLKSNGTIVSVGSNDSGQLDVGSWTDIVQVAAGGKHTVGLKSDGIEPVFLIFSA